MDALNAAERGLVLAKRLIDEDGPEIAISGALEFADVAANVAIAEALDRIAILLSGRP